jgi:hypothetical protein
MTTAIQKTLLAAAAAVLAALPLAGTAEAGPARKSGEQLVFAQHERGPVRLAARRHRGDVRTPLIDKRIANQQQRIQRGIGRGGLTRFEALRLKRRLAVIRGAVRMARFDGDVTRAERRKILGMLDVNSDRIARLAHNRRAY